MIILPDIDALRLGLSYTDVFMLTLAWNVGVLDMIILGVFIILLAVKMYHIKKQAKQQRRLSLLTYDQSSGQSNQVLVQQELNEQYPIKRVFKVINFFTSLLFYVFWISISALYLGFYAFGVFGSSTGHDILSIICMFALVTIPTLVWKLKTKHKVFKKIKKQVIFTAIMLSIWLGVCIFSVIAIKGVCLCFYNDNYGIRLQDELFFSTRWSRSLQIKPVCADGEICHLYTTLTQQTATEVFINVHSGLNLTSLKFVLKDDAGKMLIEQSKSPISLTNVDSISQRNIHSVLFKNLTAASLYEVSVIEPVNNKTLRMTNYKTLPNKDVQQLRMAVGGDIGITQNGSRLTSYLREYNPDVLLIGGDIAYDDAVRVCSYSWDNFYWIFQELDLALNRSVPMILSIGNHDVGYDALTLAKTSRQFNQIPLFLLYNPQHGSNKTKQRGVPEYMQRQTNHYHIIGNTLHVILDSGYMKTYQEQVYFIKYMGEEYPKYYKFANYHNPVYPSCTNHNPGSNDLMVIGNATKYWTPIFEEFKFVGAMEHHTHHRKITKKLTNGLPDPQGIRYIGDGSWGVHQGDCAAHRVTKTPQLFEDYERNDPNHIWQITILKNQTGSFINYTAINMEGHNVFQLTEQLPSL